uniref:Uncharacterized protein n=1 Tax=Zooxanthella nutricula TaxID=1333877 RepID=A0A7S2KT96_9DINO
MLHVDWAVKDPKWRSRMLDTLDRLGEARSRNGNWPSTCGEQGDHLVHFCHGAPGMVWLYCKAFSVFGDQRFLDYATAAAQTVWQYGILRKGPGLCHGVAGNGYALLEMFRATGDSLWLARAKHFASRMLAKDVVDASRTPDSQWSLFEGLAGTLCFLLDLRSSPSAAALPLFDPRASFGVPAGALADGGPGRKRRGAAE